MLFGKRDPLHPYERAILEAIVDTSPKNLAVLLRTQIDQIRHVQRSHVSPEINFYASRKGRPFDEGSLLPNRSEIRMADVNIQIGGARHKGHLYAVSGHIFSLVLRPAVARPKRAMLEDIDIRLLDTGLLDDSTAGTNAALETAPTSFLDREGDVQAWKGRKWAILETEEIYLVPLSEADWVVLAQGPQHELLLGRRTEDGESFCVANLETDAIRLLAASAWGSALQEAEEGAA